MSFWFQVEHHFFPSDRLVSQVTHGATGSFYLLTIFSLLKARQRNYLKDWGESKVFN